MVTGSAFPITWGEGGAPRLNDDLGEASGYPRPSGFLAVLRLCRFRHHLLVLVIWNQLPASLLTYQCLINNGSDNKFIPRATCPLPYKALALLHWM